jgi:predicted DNA-binding transcriptional regulator AlpA
MREKVGDTSYPKIWTLMQQGAFPRPYYIGTKPVWEDAEIDQVIEKLPREPQKKEQEVKHSGPRPPTSLKNLKRDTRR